MQFWYNYIVNVFGRIEVFMKENVNKQLSLSQRTRIEEMLNQRKRKFEIAYEIFTFIYGEKLAEKLDIQKIEKDEVCTTPRLLK